MSSAPPPPPQQQPTGSSPNTNPAPSIPLNPLPSNNLTTKWTSSDVSEIPKLTKSEQTTFKQSLWPRALNPPSHDKEYDWSTYFEYYYSECAVSMDSGGFRNAQGNNTLGRFSKARCHQDVLDMATRLRKGEKKADMKLALDHTFQPTTATDVKDTAMEGWITLATRALTMIPVGPLGAPFAIFAPPVPWNGTSSLKNLLHTEFQRTTPNNSKIVFDSIFTAANLDEWAGTKFEWTSNLHDHLRFSDDGHDRRVLVFRHATFLKYAKDNWSQNTIFPDEFLQETLDTLALLFPKGDKKTKRFLENARRVHQYKPDLEVNQCDVLTDRSITHFEYWHDRLEAIHNRTTLKPSSLRILLTSQFQERGPEWYAIIIALWVAVVFGLVQVIEGGWQAWHPEDKKNEERSGSQ